MPDLPTLNVTQQQAQVILESFGSAADYKSWLRHEIRLFVEHKKAQQMALEFNESKRSALASLRADLADFIPADPAPEPPVNGPSTPGPEA